MKNKLNLLQKLIDKLSTRERVLVLAGVLSIIFIIWDTFLIGPVQQQNKALLMQYQTTQNQLSDLNKRRLLADGLLKKSKRKRLLAEISQLQNEIKNFNQRISERLQGRVAPENMSEMLNDVLQNNTRLELIRINNLPAEPFLKDKDTSQQPVPPETDSLNKMDPGMAGVYKHSLEMELEGNYLDILAYLQSLETMQWKIFWDQVRMEVLEHPRIKVTIKVHTFSLKDGWLRV